MGSEKFCLKWNDFESNISVAFRELREDKDFFDVTVLCDDDQIQAHKVILSACSPFFKSVLRRNNHQHPLLYIKGVKFKELQAVLNFMYHGEVNVAQEELNTFLAVAEDLKIKGLTQNQSNDHGKAGNTVRPSNNHDRKHDIESLPSLPKRPSRPHQTVGSSQSILPHVGTDDEIREIATVKAEPKESYSNHLPQQGSDFEAENQNVYPSPTALAVESDSSYQVEDTYEDYSQYENPETDGTENQYNQGNLQVATTEEGHQCLLCGAVMKHMRNMKRHFVDKHSSQQQTHICRFCQKSYKSKNSMETHQYLYHKEEIMKLKSVVSFYQ